MIIFNKSPKGKKLHIKINGAAYEKWIGGYASLDMPEVTRLDQLHLNAHERAVIHVQEKTGFNPDLIPTPEYYFKISATNLSSPSTLGTTSLSGGSASVEYKKDYSFTIYPKANKYLSAYTVNGAAQTMVTKSSTTVYSFSNITQDKAITVAFAAYGS